MSDQFPYESFWNIKCLNEGIRKVMKFLLKEHRAEVLHSQETKMGTTSHNIFWTGST